MRKLTYSYESDAMTVQTECNQSWLWIAEVQPVFAIAKIRRFPADSKKIAELLSHLLRQPIQFATEYRNSV